MSSHFHHFRWRLWARETPSSPSAFKYSSILIAIVLGYLIWGDTPDAEMLIGAAIIIGSGILLVVHEKRQVRRNSNSMTQ